MGRPLSVSLRKLVRKIRPSNPVQLVNVSDITGSSGRTQAIPRVVYQTAESGEVHPTHFKAIQHFRSLNDDLDFVFFDKDSRDTYMQQNWTNHPILRVYQRSKFGQMKADIFRYCIIFDKGGYYIDFNKGVEGRITEFHPPAATGLVSYETNPELIFPEFETARELQNPFNLVMQWAFGFTAGHGLLSLLIQRIVDTEPFFRGHSFRDPKSALLTLTATGMFTQVFREYVKMNGLDGISEAGVDFNGKGIFRLRGSKLLWKEGEHYSVQRDLPLFDSATSSEKDS